MGSLDSCLRVIGYCTLFYYGSKIARFFLKYWRESLWSKTVDFKKFGNWAVITGGSDGIGKALAFELAKCGLNIVIISRTQAKLREAAKQIAETFAVEVKTISIDFTDDDFIYDVIEEKIKDLDVAVLVNNVGVGVVEPTEFLEVPDFEKCSTNSVNANVNAMVKLTEIVLPQMVKRKGGVIVNISSVIGDRDSPFMAVYGATKSYVIAYTQAMADEYKSQGIIFQSIAPGVVATTPIAKTTKSNFAIPTPEKYGEYAIKAVGKSVHTNTSFLWHNVFQLFAGSMPNFLFAKLMKMTAKQALADRKKMQES